MKSERGQSTVSWRISPLPLSFSLSPPVAIPPLFPSPPPVAIPSYSPPLFPPASPPLVYTDGPCGDVRPPAQGPDLQSRATRAGLIIFSTAAKTRLTASCHLSYAYYVPLRDATPPPTSITMTTLGCTLTWGLCTFCIAFPILGKREKSI